MRKLALATLLLIVPAGNAQQKQAHPGYPPTLLLASASQQDGKVIIQIAQPGPVPPPEDGKRERDAVMTEWVNLNKVTLGETVQAFGVDGERVGAKAVLKALAEPKGVAVFIGRDPKDPQAPPRVLPVPAPRGHHHPRGQARRHLQPETLSFDTRIRICYPNLVASALVGRPEDADGHGVPSRRAF